MKLSEYQIIDNFTQCIQVSVTSYYRKRPSSHYCEGTGYKDVTERKEIRCADLYSNETMPGQRWRRDFNANGGNTVMRNGILMCAAFR